MHAVKCVEADAVRYKRTDKTNIDRWRFWLQGFTVITDLIHALTKQHVLSCKINLIFNTEAFWNIRSTQFKARSSVFVILTLVNSTNVNVVTCKARRDVVSQSIKYSFPHAGV